MWSGFPVCGGTWMTCVFVIQPDNKPCFLTVNMKHTWFCCCREFQKPRHSAEAFYSQLANDKDNVPRNRASKSMDMCECAHTHTAVCKNRHIVDSAITKQPNMCLIYTQGTTAVITCLLSLHFCVVIRRLRLLSAARGDLTPWTHKPRGFPSHWMNALSVCVHVCVCVLSILVRMKGLRFPISWLAVCEEGENEEAYFFTLTWAALSFPLLVNPVLWTKSILSFFYPHYICVFISEHSLHLCFSLLFPLSTFFPADEFIGLALLYLPLFSLHLSDFQSRFIRSSALAFFLRHTPLPPKLIGFHYGQGWSAHAVSTRSHQGTTPIPTAISGFYLHLWPSSISISFPCSFSYLSYSIHPFPPQSARAETR